MPYLQLDVPNRYPADVKRGLARRMGELYARIMQTTPDKVRVAFRELPEGSLWHCGDGEPKPGAAVLSCDIRRGRSPEQRAELAQALVDACVEALELRGDLLVEFTQHTGDEIFRPGRGLADDWTSAEARTPGGNAA